MVLPVTVLRPSRRLLALLAAVLLCGSAALALMPAHAGAQSSLISASPETKAQAAAAEKAAEKAATPDDGGNVPLVVWLGIAALAVIGVAAYFILRDARTVSGPSAPRAGPRRAPVDSGSVRGAPKTMFQGEAAPGGQTGKSKKRAKGKRQKAARRNNR